jgi:hypothetical protein
VRDLGLIPEFKRRNHFPKYTIICLGTRTFSSFKLLAKICLLRHSAYYSVGKIIAGFLVKCADKSAVSIFVCLYLKDDTPTVHSFLLRFYFYLYLLFLFYLFILFYFILFIFCENDVYARAFVSMGSYAPGHVFDSIKHVMKISLIVEL